MSRNYQKEVLKKLDVLAEKIEILTKVVAISSQIQTAFKDKTKKEQIKILSELGIESRNIIALMVGTTPETVSSRLSEIKKVKSKDKRGKKENVEQGTV